MAKKTEKDKKPSSAGVTGTYVYDERLDRLVKVSDRIPRVASKAGKAGAEGNCEAPEGGFGDCGRSACGGGSCAMDD